MARARDLQSERRTTGESARACSSDFNASEQFTIQRNINEKKLMMISVNEPIANCLNDPNKCWNHGLLMIENIGQYLSPKGVLVMSVRK